MGRGRGVVHDTDALWLCVAEVATIPTFLRSACASSLCRGKGMGSVHQHGHSLVLPSVELAPLGAPRLAAAGAVQSQPSWGSAMHRVRVSPLPGSRAVQSGSRWVGRRPGAAHLGRRGCRFHSTSPSQVQVAENEVTRLWFFERGSSWHSARNGPRSDLSLTQCVLGCVGEASPDPGRGVPPVGAVRLLVRAQGRSHRAAWPLETTRCRALLAVALLCGSRRP